MSKINHVQILNIADIIATQKYALNKQRANTIKQYVEEQQVKEQRAKKVEELLGLYKENGNLLKHYLSTGSERIKSDLLDTIEANNIFIDDLEKELEEMK